jgi:predicted membrane-bound spermidine synthase
MFFLFTALVAGMAYLFAFLIRVAVAAGIVIVIAATWALVILVGLLHPRLTPRKACDWYSEFLREASVLVTGRS